MGAGGFAGPFLCRLTTTAAAAQHTVHSTAAAIIAVSSMCIARGTYAAGLWFRFIARATLCRFPAASRQDFLGSGK
jgi:hypothetical protein